MSEFQIIDERRYPLPGNVNNDMLPYFRWEHRVTIGYRGRRFMVFVDNGLPDHRGIPASPPKVYIEEITTGNLEWIEDDSMHNALSVWAELEGFTGMWKPMDKPKK